MTSAPTVQPLPYKHRTWFFRILLTVFVCAVPVFIFYAAGYRISFDDTEQNIVSVGGIFVSAEAEETVIYLNEEVVENYRLFQRAAYIPNLPAGMHRLHVQGEGVHTWVKELPVYPHIVTEAQAFNMPQTPQVRLITPYRTATGTQVVRGAASTTPLGSSVTHRASWFASSTIATSSLQRNEEYTFVTELFTATSTNNSETLRTRIRTQIEGAFLFSTEQATVTASTTDPSATTTREVTHRRLYETADGLFVQWIGSQNDFPYYFCLNLSQASTSDVGLTSYIANNLANVLEGQQQLTNRGDFACRETIRIDTQGKDILLFDFFPDNNDLVLVQLTDGLYVVEVDDRAWQNSQLLYPGSEFSVVLENQQIYISDQGYYFELLTTLEQ